MSDNVAEKTPQLGRDVPKNIYLVSYPKIVYLYPSLIAAIIAAIVTAVNGNESNAVTNTTCLVFMGVFSANLVVLSFDFPRTTSLTFFFIGVAIFMGLWLVSASYPSFLPFVGDIFRKLTPFANVMFYSIFAGVLIVIYIAVGIAVQFDYWEVRPNELLHHHGVLSDLERFSAPNLRIDKEINDLFEYLLLRAGRLILHPSNERRAIVLENVFFINKKEQQITKMLGALQVQVRSDDTHG